MARTARYSSLKREVPSVTYASWLQTPESRRLRRWSSSYAPPAIPWAWPPRSTDRSSGWTAGSVGGHDYAVAPHRSDDSSGADIRATLRVFRRPRAVHGTPQYLLAGRKRYSPKAGLALVRIVGQAPLAGTVYELDRLRCNLCGEVFAAPEPWACIKFITPTVYGCADVSSLDGLCRCITIIAGGRWQRGRTSDRFTRCGGSRWARYRSVISKLGAIRTGYAADLVVLTNPLEDFIVSGAIGHGADGRAEHLKAIENTSRGGGVMHSQSLRRGVQNAVAKAKAGRAPTKRTGGN